VCAETLRTAPLHPPLCMLQRTGHTLIEILHKQQRGQRASKKCQRALVAATSPLKAGDFNVLCNGAEGGSVGGASCLGWAEGGNAETAPESGGLSCHASIFKPGTKLKPEVRAKARLWHSAPKQRPLPRGPALVAAAPATLLTWQPLESHAQGQASRADAEQHAAASVHDRHGFVSGPKTERTNDIHGSLSSWSWAGLPYEVVCIGRAHQL
jgi:hypothetical protein